MYNPHILEVTQMFREMVKAHKEELYVASWEWKEFKDQNGNTLQIVPWVRLEFKF